MATNATASLNSDEIAVQIDASQEQDAADDDLERTRVQSNDSKDGCMFCREAVPVTRNGKLIPGSLNPGDHIATRGQICCAGLCYDHHAIVTKVTIGNGTAAIEVVDVNRKGMNYTDCTCKRCTFCCCGCCWWCSCIHCQYPIEEHKFCDATWGSATGECTDVEVKTQTIYRFEYKHRRNDLAKSKEMALKCANSENDLQYCIMTNNCESLASLCVNGSDNINDLKESISLQSRNCCWRLFHFLFWILQALFYFFNFCIYAAFVANDETFDFIPHSLKSFLKRQCYAPNNCLRGFDTRCDWYAVMVFITLFSVIFIISLSMFYQPLFRKGLICKQCLIIARLDCFSRILTFVIIEGVSIFLERPTYKTLSKLQTGGWTIPIVLGISAIGAFLVFSLSSLVTWCLGMCGMPTCSGVKQFSRYFHFRGLIWIFALLFRCFRRKMCSINRVSQI